MLAVYLNALLQVYCIGIGSKNATHYIIENALVYI